MTRGDMHGMTRVDILELTCMDAPSCSMASTLPAHAWKLPGGDEYPEGASRFRSRATSGPASASDSGALCGRPPVPPPPPPPGSPSAEGDMATLKGLFPGPDLAEEELAAMGAFRGGTVSLILGGGASSVVP